MNGYMGKFLVQFRWMCIWYDLFAPILYKFHIMCIYLYRAKIILRGCTGKNLRFSTGMNRKISTETYGKNLALIFVYGILR